MRRPNKEAAEWLPSICLVITVLIVFSSILLPFGVQMIDNQNLFNILIVELNSCMSLLQIHQNPLLVQIVTKVLV